MSSFLEDLDFYCTERLSPPDDRTYRAQAARHAEMDRRIAQALGPEFLEEYSLLALDLTQWEVQDHFRAGLRFALQLSQALT